VQSNNEMKKERRGFRIIGKRGDVLCIDERLGCTI